MGVSTPANLASRPAGGAARLQLSSDGGDNNNNNNNSGGSGGDGSSGDADKSFSFGSMVPWFFVYAGVCAAGLWAHDK